RHPMGRATATVMALPLAAALATSGPAAAPASARSRPVESVQRASARLARILDLPGYLGLIGPNGCTIYLVSEAPAASWGIVAFDWRRRRVLWRSRAASPLWPVGVAPSALILANYAQGGAPTWAPLAGLDRRTGGVLWRQPAESAQREGLIGVTLAGNFIFKAIHGQLVCLKAASGQTVWE